MSVRARGRDHLTQAGETQPRLQPLVVALQNFAIDQHRQTILETELHAVGLSFLFFECVDHADEAEVSQAIDGWMVQHSLPPQW